MFRYIKTVAVLLIAAASSTFAGPPRARQSFAPAPGPESGNGLFKSHCASCHGLSGKGDGPAAAAMRMRPTDLTQLTRRGNGAFPAARLERILGGSDALAAHGGKQMPVWGPSLAAPGAGSAQSAQRLRNLIAYIQSIQDKAK
ncbi:cytochrome c [uncultured Paludibaculum sp.]|uniref:cytochrome c n=1 Tax=uncultured Paludibaculum sp. TaxID=1765020 RepID=UPI002AABC7B3|nr:cytochrome c [uncultured Paludibaculum sp.]